MPVTTVSFPFPLAATPDGDPIVIPIGAEPTAACPGNFSEPQAAPGEICVYVSVTTATSASGPTPAR